MTFAICGVPVAPLRKEAAHRSEMTSQLLFGEGVEVLTEEGDFVQVRCRYDGYDGWCQRSQLWPATENELDVATAYGASFHTEVTLGGEKASVPFGSPLPNWEAGKCTIGENTIGYHPRESDVLSLPTSASITQLRAFAYQYLNTGYLWGGKSVYGTDCSGFVQQVFKLCGLVLPRDAYQQAEEGSKVDSVEEARNGDLAFFHNESGRVTHVGIVLDDLQVIHASGRVRIDTLEREGIVTRYGAKTHNLHSIRRYL